MKPFFKMFTTFVIVLVCLGFISSCSILKNPDVKNAENLINEIGTVTLDSTAKIEAARNAYNLLDDKQKEQVENINILDKASDEYLFLYAKSAYDDITTAFEKTAENMSIYKDAWHYGIWEDEDTLSVRGLADEVEISADELDAAIKALDIEEDVLDFAYKDEFSVGLFIVDEVFKIRGVFPEIETLLTSAKTKLKDIENQYPNYENYKALVDYYTKANSYFEFASDVTGSFDTFSETKNDYEKALEELKAPLDYIYGE